MTKPKYEQMDFSGLELVADEVNAIINALN